MPSRPCSSEARSYTAAGSSHTVGGPESMPSAFSPASTIARSPGGPLLPRRPHEEARLEGMVRRPVAVEIAAVTGVHEDVGAALQLGVDAARRLELEGAGAGAGDVVARDAVGGE